MMKHTAFSLIFTFLTRLLTAQEILFETPIELDKDKETYSVNNQDGGLSLFLLDESVIKGCGFDSLLKSIEPLETPRPDGSYDLAGASYGAGEYHLYFANKAHSKMNIVSFDYVQRRTRTQDMELPFKKERFIGAESYQGVYYVLTVVKDSNKLRLYAINDPEHYTTHEYDFKNEHFAIGPNYKLPNAVKKTVVSIDNEIPNAIATVSDKNKLYTYDHKLVLTLDNQYTRTHVIAIDLLTMKDTLTVYNQQPLSCIDAVYTSSNSYIHNHVLYQFRVCNEGLAISLHDLKTSNLLNSFHATRNEEIKFKNGGLMQRKTTDNPAPSLFLIEGEQSLSKTVQFLRKVSSPLAGITVYRAGNTIEMTLGSYEELTYRPSQWRPAPGIGPGGTMMMIYGPVFSSFKRYTNTNTVYMKSLLDATSFKHKPGGSIGFSVFDRIELFTTSIEKDITAETLFKRNNQILLGYYHKPSRKYIVRAYKL